MDSVGHAKETAPSPRVQFASLTSEGGQAQRWIDLAHSDTQMQGISLIQDGFQHLIKCISLCPLETTWIQYNFDFEEVVGKPIHSVQSVFSPFFGPLSLSPPPPPRHSLSIGKE